MKIGQIKLANPVISAPMAGITDKAYRILAKEAGCGLVCTEMVSDQALLYGNPKTCGMLNLAGESSPLSVQIFGSNPAYMAMAAEIAESRGADLIDINMGCPTPKIVKNGEGAALMKNPGLAVKIVRAVVERVRVPVTVKMRKGWDEKSINAVEMAKLLTGEGVAALTVHGRTRSQFYTGEADWEIIAAVKKAVNVPVIGNGDIRCPEDALLMMEQTGCDGVMIGRAALGNPWMFSRTAHFLKTGVVLPEPAPAERVMAALRHLNLLIENKGEKVAVREMRKHAAWYTKGVRGAAKLRDRINKAGSKEELEKILKIILCGTCEER
ncbi:tRNA dihydrouridine synthase DusB [Pelotomaculum terephthalicicum JT]|uniref:tRNA dihydrouridine synthase DusB n=1 Tax=Pelotomaculum TaxID=191373 RepID=UPI0009CF734F|nr:MULTISPECIES: tRNA dihydrouridine synthase DusB [Pelotomaculum]MCG9968278.1 tRNA dihydrouridine synthase DusB [Pelotomaculum terephthalicicum JT]OPX89517.1 MAG: tRNA-dihydrouridine synthase C [Pelotomaculum sp. PtaB.Bin117]OPY63274.1 MAG: tRNA-dihydrouridine synthase C [Pelotomaculum sp. PtaU1.Bin065]